MVKNIELPLKKFKKMVDKWLYLQYNILIFNDKEKKMSNTINFPLTEKRKKQLNAEHKQKARDEIKRLIALRK